MPREITTTRADGARRKQFTHQESVAGSAEKPMTSFDVRMEHYHQGTQDMDQRRLRKNGWNDCIRSYLGVLPNNWPYQSKVTDPRIHTNINEKTARLINGKLRGTVSGREGSDDAGARIHNAILDFQWDAATRGGSMVEKIAKADQLTRIFGAAYSLNYWDAEKNSNESRPVDPRDILFDPSADHVHNARWVQIREYVTVDELKDMGFDVSDIDFGMTQKRESNYDSIVKEVRGLEDRTGDDPANPLVELVTEWVPKWATADREGQKIVFLPHYARVLHEGPNPYQHGKAPVSQLRYYPIHDDMYGESEIEPVLPLQRGINATLCGYVDEMNIKMRPPTKVIAGQVRMDSIEYAPNAIWIVNRQDAVEEVQGGGNAIQFFNNTYPALVAALNQAMGDQSLAVPNVPGKGFSDKTATEVRSLQQQTFTRDQYNQIFLSEYLKDIMMQWLANNQQFLFDDETKHVQVLKIIGKDKIQDLEELGLAEEFVSDEVMQQISEAVIAAGGDVADEDMEEILQQVTLPRNAVVMNPQETDPEQLEIRPKLQMTGNNEAELAMTAEDLAGLYDYIPDVKSMAAGASQTQQDARRVALEAARDKTTIELLDREGIRFKFSKLLGTVLEDAGYRDAESLFEEIPNAPQPGQPAAMVPAGPAIGPASPGAAAAQGVGDLAAVPEALPVAAGGAGQPEIPQGLPGVA